MSMYLHIRFWTNKSIITDMRAKRQISYKIITIVYMRPSRLTLHSHNGIQTIDLGFLIKMVQSFLKSDKN